MKTTRAFPYLLIIVIIISIFTQLGGVSAYSEDPQSTGTKYYVTPSANGDCSSWINACELQTAIFLANPGDQIWVAAGIYKPTTSEDREASFILKNGVEIYGGFPAEGGSWENRDWGANVTTLSGEIGLVNDVTDNSYHVVSVRNIDSTTVLDGFIIEAGSATGVEPYDSGGGMYLLESSLVLNNLTLRDNLAINGGGMYNETSNPSLKFVVFESNTAIFGGGMNNRLQSSPTIIDVVFANNYANTGAGMSNFDESDPVITNVTFSNNNASAWGGGIHNENSSPTLTNVTFSGNFAGMGGGGMHNYSQSSPVLQNVTFIGNSGLPFGDALFDQYYSYPTLVNCIVWDGTFGIINRMARISYSIVEGGYLGIGNIDTDPLLGPLSDNGGFTKTHALLEGSPAIDAGSLGICPETDQRNIGRPKDGNSDGAEVCDIGAYEFFASDESTSSDVLLLRDQPRFSQMCGSGNLPNEILRFSSNFGAGRNKCLPDR